tara:strand:+ start:131502 stop:132077 length:576 start_codon:yes stop_codon:yes gene_type:complete
MKTISVIGAIKEGWGSFRSRPWYLMGLALSVWVLFALGTSNAAFTALGYIIFGGYIAVMMRHLAGDRVVFDDLFSLDSRWISFVFLGMIKFIFILIGLVLFIVPGIYLIVKWMFAEYLVIEKGMKPMEALRASSEMTKGNRWKLFGFMLLSMLIGLAGLIVLGVGVLASSSIVILATIKLYKELQSSEVAV